MGTGDQGGRSLWQQLPKNEHRARCGTIHKSGGEFQEGKKYARKGTLCDHNGQRHTCVQEFFSVGQHKPEIGATIEYDRNRNTYVQKFLRLIKFQSQSWRKVVGRGEEGAIGKAPQVWANLKDNQAAI